MLLQFMLKKARISLFATAFFTTVAMAFLSPQAILWHQGIFSSKAIISMTMAMLAACWNTTITRRQSALPFNIITSVLYARVVLAITSKTVLPDLWCVTIGLKAAIANSTLWMAKTAF